MPLYFDSSHLPPPTGEYIAWCDGMGTGRALANSLHHSANFVFKLHRAFSEAIDQLGGGHDVRVYPLMDGMYLATRNRSALQTVIRNAFTALANEFIVHNELSRHFLVRGGIAYGITLHGESIPDNAFIPGIGTTFEAENRAAFEASALNRTRSQLLLSSAMVPAYSSESLAPPFGLYVDDSALSVPQLADANDRGFPSKLWRWWSAGDNRHREAAAALWPALDAYFHQAGQKLHELAYPEENLRRHKTWATEYFQEFTAGT